MKSGHARFLAVVILLCIAAAWYQTSCRETYKSSSKKKKYTAERKRRRTFGAINWNLAAKNRVVGRRSATLPLQPRDFRANADVAGIIAAAKQLTALQAYDQVTLGSCVANALAMAFRYAFLRVSGGSDLPLSRMWLYYLERNVNCTNGSMTLCRLARQLSGIRGGIPKHIVDRVPLHGILMESDWPYPAPRSKPVESQAVVNTPPPGSFEKAVLLGNKYGFRSNGIIVDNVVSVQGVKQCIDEGTPVAICLRTAPNMFADDGDIRIPSPAEFDGAGHCILITGYNDAAQCFVILNSWGPNWAVNGRGVLSYAVWEKPVLAKNNGYRFRLR